MGERAAQEPNARRADKTAASASSLVPLGMRSINSSVAGFRTAISPPPPGTRLLPIQLVCILIFFQVVVWRKLDDPVLKKFLIKSALDNVDSQTAATSFFIFSQHVATSFIHRLYNFIQGNKMNSITPRRNNTYL
jgi:hypothetical protein